MHRRLYNSIWGVTLSAALQVTVAQQAKHVGMSAATGHWCIAYNLHQSFRLSRVRSFALSVIVYYGVQMRRVRL